MIPRYPKDQIWKIYNQLPEELKDMIFAEETAESIAQACEAAEIKDEKVIKEIARLTGHVLLGLFPPDEFQLTLREEFGLDQRTARKIAFRIYRFIFFPVKAALGNLYEMEILAPVPVGPIEIGKPTKVETKKEDNNDSYREPIA